ncbi:hypothetical protein M433DRAFT_326856 [Acidomyces richmondensis BFW]|nr:MAG: hypothetical protein FE78DRAFT_464961 [Acidomyces sp. 'richmondensis']KYG43939.1 hypothetical protein M433DRAFT_326856 [Acidomyces richmondensis BFW]
MDTTKPGLAFAFVQCLPSASPREDLFRSLTGHRRALINNTPFGRLTVRTSYIREESETMPPTVAKEILMPESLSLYANDHESIGNGVI